MPSVAAVATSATMPAIRMVRFPRIVPRVVGLKTHCFTASCAQRSLGDFAHRVAGEGVQVANFARALVRSQERRDVVGELLLTRTGGALLHDDPRDDPLAEIVVGLTRDRRLGDR